MKKILFILIGVFFLLTSTAFAQGTWNVTLQWAANHESDLAGYKVYYDDAGTNPPYTGKAAAQGPSPITITLADDENPDPEIVQYTVNGLRDDWVWFFAVTAYDTEGFESPYSNEVMQPAYVPEPEPNPDEGVPPSAPNQLNIKAVIHISVSVN